MEIRMVDLKGQYDKIKPEIDEAIQAVINATSFIKGPFVQRFSENLSGYLGCRYIIPCGNGTDALQLAIMALGLERGDEIITTPFTFVATAEVIVLLGLKPVFVDVEPDTFNINPDLIEEAISPRTKAIIPVHLFGQSCNMDAISEIAAKHGLKIIEDTAQAIGADYKGKKCGTIGDVGTLSFFPSKNLGCYGDGGAVMTNDKALADRMNLYANHGSLNKYYYEDIGINSRLDAIQAAILDVKLRYLEEYIESRIVAADIYDNLLEGLDDIITPFRINDGRHVFHQYTLKIKEGRDEIQSYLKSNGVPSAIYYPKPLHQQSIYQAYAGKKGALPVTESLCNSVLSLPMHTELNEKMQNHIVEVLKGAFELIG